MVVLIIYMSDSQRGEITVFYVLKPKLIRIIFICKGSACIIVVFRRITNDKRTYQIRGFPIGQTW